MRRPGSGGLLDRRVAAVVVAHADDPHHRLVAAREFVADEAAAHRAHHGGDRAAGAAADEAAQTAADQGAADGARRVRHVLHRVLLDRLDRADAGRGHLADLERRGRVAAGERQCRHCGERYGAEPGTQLLQHAGFSWIGCGDQSGIALSRYMAASRPDGTAELAQPLREDRLDVAADIDLRQRPVDLEAQRRIAARQCQRIRLERNVLGQHRELARVLGLRGEPDQLDLVARVGIHGARLEHRDARVGVVDLDERRIDQPPLHVFQKPAFGRRALEYGDALAAHVADPVDRRIGAHQQAAAVDEGEVREVHVGQARLRLRGVGALEVRAARCHHLQALGDRTHQPVDLERGLADGAADLGDDLLAQVDRVAGGLVARADEREGQRVARERHVDGLGGLDLRQRVDRRLRARAAGAEECGSDESD